MFDGKTFLPETGMPMRKIACMISPFALADPVPFTVPILKAKSFVITAEAANYELRPASSNPGGLGLQLAVRSSQFFQHTESASRTSSYPTPQSDTAPHTARSAGTRPRP